MSELGDFGLVHEVEGEEPGTEAEGTEEYNPFAGGNQTEVASLITLMRIYDVLLAIYADSDDDACEKLMAVHNAGKLIGPLPSLDLD